MCGKLLLYGMIGGGQQPKSIQAYLNVLVCELGLRACSAVDRTADV